MVWSYNLHYYISSILYTYMNMGVCHVYALIGSIYGSLENAGS